MVPEDAPPTTKSSRPSLLKSAIPRGA